MLLERATGLADKINRYQSLKAAAGQAEMYRTRANQLGQVRTSLTEARAALERFHVSGVRVDFVALNADALEEKATTLRDIVQADPTVLANPPFNLKFDFTDRLLGIGTSAREAIDRAWVQYVAAHGPTGSSEVLDALAKLPQFQLSVARIRRCHQSIEELTKRTPADPEKAIETSNAIDCRVSRGLVRAQRRRDSTDGYSLSSSLCGQRGATVRVDGRGSWMVRGAGAT